MTFIRLKAVLVKEFIQMRRDSTTLIIMFMLPFIQLLIFGLAIHTDVKHQSTIVFDQCMTEDSRDLLTSFTASEYFDINYVGTSFNDVNEAIDMGKAKIGIVIPPDLTENLKHGRSTPIQVIVDASDNISSSSALSAAQVIGQMKSTEVLLKKAARQSADSLNMYDMRIRAWYNRDSITVYYILPGIMGIILTMTMVMITAMAIVRERERGTLEQLLVTPLKTWELLLGKIIPYMVIGYVQTTISILVGLGVFSVPMRGSILLLYALTTLFIGASLTLGILISTIAKTQMQAMQMSFVVFLPSILLSGFMFPREAMPVLFQWISALFPMTYYVEITRGIFLKGVGFAALYTQAMALAVLITATFGIAVKKFARNVL
ncbi:MAG: ABC transporter permease [Megasphaera sp.]|jgi:ABC-2 type transport system permease protein|nr:ABC transporter permease [Megasphaera sp.]MCH4218508.1 ABC transporter permease [Megasphaera sp.]